MRNEITEKRIIATEKEVVIGNTVTCNKCGETCEPDYDEDMQAISLSFGYESRFDGGNWQFDLCDNCILEIIKAFKHVPDRFMEDSNYYLMDSIEEHQKVFDHWKETGEWDEFKFKTYEKIVEMNGLFDTEYLNDVIKKYHPNKPELETYNDED